MDEDAEILAEFLVESEEHLDQLDSDLVEWEKQPTNSEIVTRVFRAFHTIKGTAGFLDFKRLEELTHTAETLLSGVRDGTIEYDAKIANALLDTVDTVRAILATINQTNTEGNPDTADLVQILVSLNSPNSTDASVMPPPITAETRTDSQSLALVAASQSRTSTSDPRVRIDVSTLDNLMNLAGELVLARNQIMQVAAQRNDSVLTTAAQGLNLITSELQERVMKTRMQPIDTIWSRFPRVVRDLAKACGKDVVLTIEGKETELDRTIIEAMKDPMTHLIRNALDHGLETADERRASGKPPEGRVVLRAFHEGGQVVIEIGDDGRGIDPQRIARKAIDKSLLEAAAVRQMNDREILQILFLPGFSTAETITNISGRGVGMDVVKSSIEHIGGTVEIDSTLTVGTTFRVKIPLTLAIVPTLIVGCGQEQYAIPQVCLTELVRVMAGSNHEIEYVHGCPVYRLRDALLPLIDLRALLDSEGCERMHCDLCIVVVKLGAQQFGLIVDRIHDTAEIVVKPLGELLASSPLFSGGTILGDGDVALIVDIPRLAERCGITSDASTSWLEYVEDKPQSEHSGASTMLLFSCADGRQMALELASVTRLEKFSRTEVERAGDRLVLQYREGLLELVDVHHLLSSVPPSKLWIESADVRTFQVVVFAVSNGKLVGLVVDDVLDVVEEIVELRTSGQREGVLGSAVIGDRITEVVDFQSLRVVAERFLERTVTERISP